MSPHTRQHDTAKDARYKNTSTPVKMAPLLMCSFKKSPFSQYVLEGTEGLGENAHTDSDSTEHSYRIQVRKYFLNA